MALKLRERNRVDEFANYEQQSPDRDMYIRTVDTQQNYQGGYDYYNQYAQGYAQPQQDYQQPQYTGYFQSQASQYVSNGFSNVPQYDYGYDYANSQYQQPQIVRANQINQIHERSEWLKKANKAGKKTINKDMIKIIVAIMVVAVTICGLLIANQFISVNHQAQADEDVQNIDSELLSSVVVEDGSYVSANVTTIPEYQYEKSTNWFDKFCDSLGLKLK